MLGVIRIFTLRRERYDFIYITNNNLYNLTLGIFASRILSVPSIVVVHHLRWINYLDLSVPISFSLKKAFKFMRMARLDVVSSLVRAGGAYVENNLLKRVNVCITISNITASQLKDLGCTKIFVSGNGLDENLGNENFNQNAKIYDAIYVGRLDEGKGIFDLLEMWKMVTKDLPGGKLAVVGTGLLYDKAQAFIEKEGLKNSVQLFGFIGDEEVKKLLMSSRLFVTLSVTEGFGLAVGKALAYNLPVICYDIPPLREVYGKCTHVKFVEIYEIAQAAREVVKLLMERKNPNKRAGHLWDFMSGYSWVDVAQREYLAIQSIMTKA